MRKMGVIWDMEEIKDIYKKQRKYFNTGATLSYAFRKEQLRRFMNMMNQYEQDMLDAMAADIGKSRFEGYTHEIASVKSDIKFALKNLRSWMRDERISDALTTFPARHFNHASPYGNVLLIAPWNYPVRLALLPLVGVIAAGNTTVLKPSELAPNMSKVFKRMISETFDSEYLHVVEGGVPESNALLSQPFNYIFFTGSTAVGKVVMMAASEHLVPVTLELGGKCTTIVDETASLVIAAKRIVWGRFMNGGQSCTAPDFVVAHESVKDRLIELIVKETIDQWGSNPKENEDYGRIVTQRHLDRLIGFLRDGELVHGGEHDAEDRYLAPTILDNIQWDDPIMQEEIFGPILPIMSYSNWDALMARLKTMPSPLALYLFSKSRPHEKQVLHELSFGNACINDVIMHMANHHLPFGGVGDSGMGRYHGRYSFQTFSHVKGITKTPTWLSIPLRFAPYGSRIKLVRRLLG